MVRVEAGLAMVADEVLWGLAYPDDLSRGTWDCVTRMYLAGVPVLVWTPTSTTRARLDLLVKQQDCSTSRCGNRTALVPTAMRESRAISEVLFALRGATDVE